jgi:hypothetical protein
MILIIPTHGPDAWKHLLAEPEKHWRQGFSAMSTAFSWEGADGIPKEIESLFAHADEPAIRIDELLEAYPDIKGDNISESLRYAA